MFGKHFASMYSGSMFGKKALVFAVWGYAISMMRPDRKTGASFVELNPQLLAATFCSTTPEVLEAIRDLCTPDERSRTKIEGGRRLVAVDEDAPLHEGPMQFRVVNGSKYRAIRDEEERRIYLREAKRKERAVNKKVDSQPPSSAVIRRHPASSYVEAEVEVEATDPTPVPASVGGESMREGGSTKIDLKHVVSTIRSNPLMVDRGKSEKELQSLVAREAELTNRDPVEVFAEVSHYHGAKRHAVNAANMTDDRLLNSILDARSRVKALEARDAKRRAV